MRKLEVILMHLASCGMLLNIPAAGIFYSSAALACLRSADSPFIQPSRSVHCILRPV